MSFGHKGDKGNVVDDPATFELAFNVGKVILNFGAIEMRMIELAEIISRDTTNYQKALGLPFKDRVALVRKLTEDSDVAAELKDQLLNELSRAEELAKVRNDLAHNPCLLIWTKDSDRSGPPDAIGIPLIRELRGKTTRDVRAVSIGAVKYAVDQTSEGAAALSRIRDAVVAALT